MREREGGGGERAGTISLESMKDWELEKRKRKLTNDENKAASQREREGERGETKRERGERQREL